MSLSINHLPEFIEGKGEVKGITFLKVYETNEFYVYQRSDNSFEVFKRKTTPICLDFDKKIYSETNLKEIYPKSNDFGIWAWSVNSIELAIQCINKYYNHGS